MNPFFIQLFEYQYQCNQELIKVVLAHPDLCPEKAFKLLNHILNAHQIWNHRLLGKPEGIQVWSMRNTDKLAAIDHKNYEMSMQILQENSLDNSINQQPKTLNFKGNEISIETILFHVINHSTYHRGQIATAFREAGIEPLRTDYILFKI